VRNLSGGLEGFERETGYVAKDSVVGDERYSDPDGGCCDPPIGIVLALCQRVTDGRTVCAQLRTDGHKLGAGVNDFRAVDLGVELQHPCFAPSTPNGPVP
jgi:hypothetical protein